MIEKVDRELRAVYNDMKRIDATESLKLRGKREKIFCFPLCDSLRPDRISNPQREPGGPQPSGQGRVQIRWRQNDYCRVFQPSHARAQDFRRFSPIWRSVAHRSRQCDLVCDQSGFGCRRKEYSRRQLYALHPSHTIQMDIDHQQAIRRVRNPVSRRAIRFCPHRNETFETPVTS